MNCRDRGSAKALKPDNPSKPGNGVQSYDHKDLMERHTIERRPYWEDAPTVIDSDTN